MAFDGITIDLGSIDHIEGAPGEAKFLPGPQGPQGEPGVSVSDISVERTSGTGAAGTTDTYTGTVSFDDGTSTTFTFEVYNGEDGEVGAAATIAVGNVSKGENASVTNSGTSSAAVFDFVLPKGDKGDTGDTGATGATGTSVTGVTVARTSGTGAAGTTDTYTGTVTFSDSTSTTFTFNVYNGADGQGTGDMLKSVYDTDNDGVVDDAEKLGGQSPDYYAKATNGIYYAKTAGTGVAQVATIAGITQYYDGLCVALIFNVSTRSDATININNLGAVPLRENTDTEGAAGNESIYSPGGAMRVFVYDADNALFRGVYDYSTYDRIHMVATEWSNAEKQADRISQNSNYFHAPCYQLVYFAFDNNARSALTLTLWTGPFSWSKAPIYINGEASSATNYTLPKGLYLVLWDGTNYYVNTNGTLPGTQAPLTFDSAPTASSTNPVTSGGVYDALAPLRTVDATPTASSTNLVESGGVASAVSAVQDTVSRRNLFDNWYFVGGGSQQGGGQFPINQRGQTTYSIAGYGIDRWIVNGGGSLALNTGYISLETSTMYGGFTQRFEEGAIKDGSKLTLSVLTDTGLYSVTFTASKTTPYASDTTWLGVSGLYAYFDWYSSGGAQYWRIYIVDNADGQSHTVNLIAAKLEMGADQTLAHQENGVWVLNEIPSFAEELLKCQRYFLRIKGYCTAYQTASSVVPYQLFVQFPVVMRAVPTISNVAYIGSAQASGIDAGYSSMVRFYSTSGGFALDSFTASADL